MTAISPSSIGVRVCMCVCVCVNRCQTVPFKRRLGKEVKRCPGFGWSRGTAVSKRFNQKGRRRHLLHALTRNWGKEIYISTRAHTCINLRLTLNSTTKMKKNIENHRMTNGAKSNDIAKKLNTANNHISVIIL